MKLNLILNESELVDKYKKTLKALKPSRNSLFLMLKDH